MNRRGFIKLLSAGLAGYAVGANVVANYAPKQLSVAIKWTASRAEAAKIALVERLIQNAFEAYDRQIEEALFRSTHESKSIFTPFVRGCGCDGCTGKYPGKRHQGNGMERDGWS